MKSLALELLEHLLVCGSSLAISALFLPYGTTLGQSLRNIDRQLASCPHDFSRHSQQTVSTTLSRLKKRGLINTHGPKKKTLWAITRKGKEHFKEMSVKDKLPLEDGKIRLVIYDIPEEMNIYRVWLRNRLSECDYRYLQKSVWMGNRPLPKKLYDELKERKLFSYVHVVGVEGVFNR